MKKSCVFCGKPPESKTKEHVVPKWLIELTGKPNRQAKFGLIKLGERRGEFRKYAFNNFTFPACDECNSFYSTLENSAKQVVEKIIENKKINSIELTHFMDWFDKVRVGIWLGMSQLDQYLFTGSPNYYIQNRIGQFDRVLIVEKSNSKTPKLMFNGTDTILSYMMPSAFVLRINNFYFTNISYMFLISRRIGFPYPKKISWLSNNMFEGFLVDGRERIMSPLIRNNIADKGIRLYQVMFPTGGLLLGDGSNYNTAYVKKHSLYHSKGVGNIFLEMENKMTEITQDDFINLNPEHIQDDELLFAKSSINVLKWQNWLAENMFPEVSKLPSKARKDIKTRYRAGIKINKIAIRRFETEHF